MISPSEFLERMSLEDQPLQKKYPAGSDWSLLKLLQRFKEMYEDAQDIEDGKELTAFYKNIEDKAEKGDQLSFIRKEAIKYVGGLKSEMSIKEREQAIYDFEAGAAWGLSVEMSEDHSIKNQQQNK